MEPVPILFMASHQYERILVFSQINACRETNHYQARQTGEIGRKRTRFCQMGVILVVLILQKHHKANPICTSVTIHTLICCSNGFWHRIRMFLTLQEAVSANCSKVDVQQILITAI